MSIQIIANQNLRETLFCMPNEVSRKIPTIRAIYRSVDKDDTDYITQQQLQSQRLQLFLYTEKKQGMNFGQMKSSELCKPQHKQEKYLYNIKQQEQNNQKLKAKQVEKLKQQDVYEITDCSENDILNEQNGELEQNQNQVYYLSQTNSDQYDLTNSNDNNILCNKMSLLNIDIQGYHKKKIA
ncbi:hypothetical protein PPERSA_11845 [Pseudocohnilembus persalinus]|uniref:Uncharacterized protein n=1 Tax=Pseudocohnilembus persalinus TaxID=266149 RepID=A0A0V0QJQ4_PSEPJ|nr:hypothetical protein PPERSA_11845 [Pseudocohnilembus persalinus]|eukprot:KRX02505.1 hypothetical protein PPERSA_11845 [Pseudocohnilembus persalinus]